MCEMLKYKTFTRIINRVYLNLNKIYSQLISSNFMRLLFIDYISLSNASLMILDFRNFIYNINRKMQNKYKGKFLSVFKFAMLMFFLVMLLYLIDNL